MTDYKVLKVSKEDYEALEGYTWFAMDKDGEVYCYQDEPKRKDTYWTLVDQYKEANFPSNVTSKVLKMLQGEGWCTSLIKVEQAGDGEFTLEMLENGEHLVKTRAGKIYYVFGGKFLPSDGSTFRDPVHYNQNLSHSSLKEEDIVEVLVDKEIAKGLLLSVSIWKEPKKNQEALNRIQKAEEELKAARAALEEN